MSFEIDKTKFKAIQKKQKMRNLAIKNPNKNEADVAHKKAGGPKLVGEKFGQWKQAVKDRDKAAGKKYKKKSINRKKKWREGGNEKLKDVNKPAEKQSMQAVGGFRGVHGANRKSKAAQGKPAPVVYSYKKKEVSEGKLDRVMATVRKYTNKNKKKPTPHKYPPGASGGDAGRKAAKVVRDKEQRKYVGFLPANEQKIWDRLKFHIK